MAKPDKQYDLSRYIRNSLAASSNSGMISSDMDTDTDNYLFAQSVMDIEITDESPDPNLLKWISHARSISQDVINIVSSESTALALPSDPADTDNGRISLAQSLYLLGLMYQLKPFDILDRLKLAKICPALWAKSKNKTYLDNLDAIKLMNAEQLEAIVISEAMKNPSANIERMFAVKAWIPRYRDNAPMPAAPAVVLRVSIEGQLIDTGTGRRPIDITEDSQQD